MTTTTYVLAFARRYVWVRLLHEAINERRLQAYIVSSLIGTISASHNPIDITTILHDMAVLILSCNLNLHVLILPR